MGTRPACGAFDHKRYCQSGEAVARQRASFIAGRSVTSMRKMKTVDDRRDSQRKSDLTRRRILDVAAYWFNKKGLAFTSLTDLAKLAKVNPSSIYYYFESKDKLIEEVLRIGIELTQREVRQAVEALPVHASYRERLHAAMKAHLKAVIGHNDYASANIINYSHAPEHVRSIIKLERRAYGEYWKTLFEEAQKRGEIAADVDITLVRLFVGASLNWAVEWHTPKGKSISEIADECYRMVFDGIAGRKAA